MPPDDAEKIIVDEDWKSRVAAEKAAAEKAATAAGPEELQSTGAPPPASFTGLVSMLTTQTLLALGQAVYPGQEKAEVHPEEARHFIDLLGMLEGKTQGNLTTEESLLLSNVLHELRLAYVYTTEQPAAAEPAKSSPIITP